MTISFNCATFNVGTVQDLLELAQANGESISWDDAAQRYETNIRPTLLSLVEDLDFVCMQEMYRGVEYPEHDSLVRSLKNYGFQCVGNNRLGVAYNNRRFAQMAVGSIPVDEDCKKIRPSFYVDLQDRRSKKIIRVVSAHLKGYNVSTQKANTRATKADRCPNPSRLILEKRRATILGDTELIQTVKHVSMVNDQKPDVIVIGMDANSTAKYIPDPTRRVHSSRLQRLINAQFKCDIEDTNPTLFDKSDRIARKFDYIFARTPEGHPEVTIKMHKGYNLETLDHRVMMSDHVPVFAQITINKLPTKSKNQPPKNPVPV